MSVYRTEINTGTRSGFAALVVAAHVVVIYAVAVSLGVVEAPPIVKDSQVVFIETPKPVEEPPPKPVAKPRPADPEIEMPIPAPVEAPPIETAPVVEPTPVPESAPVAIPAPEFPSTSLSVTSRVDPVYPPASRRANEEGQVQLRVLVDESGRPREVEVLRSSGFDRLDEAAITAVKRWRFKPAKQGAGPVTAWTRVNVLFRLDG